MRKLSTILSVAAAVLWQPLGGVAQTTQPENAAHNPAIGQTTQLHHQNYAEPTSVSVSAPVTLKAASVSQTPAVIASQQALKARLRSTADINGTYVHTYTSLTEGTESGGALQVSAIAGTDSVLLVNFHPHIASRVKAHLNLATGAITIPNQVVTTDPTLGDLDLAIINPNATPDRSRPITGSIQPDGTVKLNEWWALFVCGNNENKDKFITGSAVYNSVLEKSNATLSTTAKVTGSDGTPTMRTLTFPLVVKQTSANILSIKNLVNYGYTIDMVLNRDRSATIASQVAMANENGTWQTKGNTVFDENNKFKSYTENITCDKATDLRTIKWHNWTLLTSGYYYGNMLDATLTTTFDISYPQLSVSEFRGEGTEANPYLIGSLDELILLSDKVAEVNEFPWTTPPVKSTYARVFMGKYFKLDKDIDMKGYRFTPIGADWQHIFAGTFDGDGHTISNLTVNTGANGYAALIGRADTVSVIKNVKLVNPSVEAAGYYAAPLVGWSLGTVENCHSTGAKAYNAGSTSAGLVGIVRVIRNCSTTNANVTSLYGHGSGLAGQVDEWAENCYAINAKLTTKGITSNGAISGGVIASLYKGNARNLYFSGTLDAASMYSAQTVGGVVGSMYMATLENSFATGHLRGYNTDAVTGGVVGLMRGSIKNCYFAGRIDSPSSRNTGGVTGMVNTTPDKEGNTLQPAITDCYTQANITAETYLYDGTKEFRELLGSISADVKPVVTNSWYDKQVTNFGSTKYGTYTNYLTAASGPAGWDSSVWTFTAGYYPRLKWAAETEAAKFSATTILTDTLSNFAKLEHDVTVNVMGKTQVGFYRSGKLSTQGNYATMNGNKITIGNKFGSDTLFIVNDEGLQYYHILKVCPTYKVFQGKGSAEEPFLINNKQDLITLSDITTNIKQLYPGTYFRITADIDIEGDTAFVGICTNAPDAHNQFEGVIDGAGHTIHGMKLGKIVWTKAPTATSLGTPNTTACKAYQSFIGRLGATGVVKNLTIAADNTLYGWATSGGVVAYNYGTIENCRNYADVTTLSCWVGGIAGQNVGSAKIINCYNAGKISTGYFAAGGILGSGSGLIEGCVNTGDIYAGQLSTFNTNAKTNTVGGIVGTAQSGLVIRNVLNTGTVVSRSTKAGGIAASFSNNNTSMENAVNYGMVYNADGPSLGTIGGQYADVAKAKNVYWDAQLLPFKANANSDHEGMTGLTTAMLTAGVAPEGIDASAWSFEAGSYPVLKAFASEPAVVAARRTIINIPDGMTAYSLSGDVQLSTFDGLKWRLAKGDVFTLEGNTLKAPASVATVVTDTLYAETAGMVKPILIKASPSVPLKGNGTEASPYLISSADEWNSVVEYSLATADEFDGKYLKLTADIDFAGKTFASFGSNGTTAFQGTFDGAGHTVSGISQTVKVNYVSGAFATIGANATVKDLTLAGKISSAFTYTAAFTGKLYGRLENCVNLVDVTSTKTNVSGMVGQAYTGASLVNCVNRGTITGSAAYISGVVSNTQVNVDLTACGNEGTIVNKGTGGYTAGLVSVAFPGNYSKCWNTGEIDIQKPTSVSNVAGLIANLNAAKDAAPFVFNGCYNTADVVANAVVGGLTALTNKTAGTVKVIADSCYNKGDVMSVSTKAVSSSPTAGLFALYTPGSTYTNCWNEGNVMSNKNVYCSGVVGSYSVTPTAALPVVIRNCWNTGDITANGNDGGGVTGYIPAYTTVDSCYNTGRVEGTTIIGGITCIMSGSGTMTNCWNTGEIVAATCKAGGLTGISNYTNSITNCWNGGDVKTTSTVQGTVSAAGYAIGGLSGTGAATFTDCFNAGTVTGVSQVGGLVGLPTKGRTSFYRCYNAGEVVAPADSCGAIVGVNITNGKVWNADNKVVDTYYDSALCTSTLPVTGTGLSTADLSKIELEGWATPGNYCLPVTSHFRDHSAAQLYSAALIFQEGDSRRNVSKSFKVGTPAGVTWSAPLGVKFSGNDAEPDGTTTGEVTLTATNGDMTRKVTVNLATTTGIDSIKTDADVVKAVYYTVSGMQVEEPAAADGQVYIVVLTYADGTMRTVKLINK